MKKSILQTILGLVVIVGALWFIWLWFFCRFYVGPDQMAVIVKKSGRDTPAGRILAGPGERGIQANVLGEGRYFLNPFEYEHRIHPTALIPPGKCGIVTAKDGQDLPPGEFLANRGEKGIWRDALGPGKYRLNPYGFNVEIVDAVNIPLGFVGVVTSLSGEQAPAGQFATARQKGVMRDVLQPGLYYINPKRFKVDIVEVGLNQVSLLGELGAVVTKGQFTSQNAMVEQLQQKALDQKRADRMQYMEDNRPADWGVNRAGNAPAAGRARRNAPPPTQEERQQMLQAPDVQMAGQTGYTLDEQVAFPSRDGFEIGLHMTVEFELSPENIAWIYSNYGDLPAVVDKIIMPQIQSISRLKGSAYRAKDFIVGEGREKFQVDLTEALSTTLAEKKIAVHNALIRHVQVPDQILNPIREASIAVERNLTNVEQQNTAKKQAQLNTELSLIEQRKQEVAQETEKMRAEIKARQEKQVAEIAATMQRKVAEIASQTAVVQAERTRKLGEAEAHVVQLIEGEKALGYQLKTQAFGDPAAFTLWEFANQLNPDLRISILHTGPGTLWTDLNQAAMGALGGALQGAKAAAPAK